MTRFDQCAETCATDCGHCKGRPVEALRADNERLARRLAGRFEETEKLRAEVARLTAERDEWEAGCKRALREREETEAEMDRRLTEAWAERDEARAYVDAAVKAAVAAHRLLVELRAYVAAGYTAGTGAAGKRLVDAIKGLDAPTTTNDTE